MRARSDFEHHAREGISNVRGPGHAVKISSSVHHQTTLWEAVFVASCEGVENEGSTAAGGDLKDSTASIVAVGAAARGRRAVKIAGSIHDDAPGWPRITGRRS